MKTIVLTILSLYYFAGQAQTAIPSDTISVSYQLTTNLIFPYSIVKADLGSADLIGKKAGKKDNVLLIRANRKNFAPTNLSVYTSDGRFYSFIVRYGMNPDPLNISFATERLTVHAENEVTEAHLDSDAVIVRNQPGFLHKQAHNQQIALKLNGIYNKDHLLWLQLEVKNSSALEYEPDHIRFFIRQRHISKRMAVQENELTPIYKPALKAIPGHSQEIYMVGLPKFSVTRQQKLNIEISESEGMRAIALSLKAGTILKVRNPS